MRAVLFVYVWPEPRSSAAGVRTRDLIRWLQGAGYELFAISPSGESEHSQALENLGVKAISCAANQSQQDDYLKSLRPDLVLFDRFVMEEQFGWKCREFWPDALQIIDTQDLHSVRRLREAALKNNRPAHEIKELPGLPRSEDLLREIASLYRADGALLVSSWEYEFLTERLAMPAELLLHLPLIGAIDQERPGFTERRGFSFLGNFRHAPNLDGINWAIESLWPALRKASPQAELHLYGAYPPAKISSWKGKNGIFAHGPVADHRAALKKHRALIAPLRFGAGIKGKILEAWGTGTPVLGTSIALEGMDDSAPTFHDEASFSENLLKLDTDEIHWQAVQSRGLARLNDFSEPALRNRFFRFLGERYEHLKKEGRTGLIGAILRQAGSNSTKYFSRWIEEKNKKLKS